MENLSQTMVETRDTENDDIPEVDTTSFDSRVEPVENNVPDGAELSDYQQDASFDPDTRIDAMDSPSNDISVPDSYDPDDRIDIPQTENSIEENIDAADSPSNNEAEDEETPIDTNNIDVPESDFALETGDDQVDNAEYANNETESSVDELVTRKNNEKEINPNESVDDQGDTSDIVEQSDSIIGETQDIQKTRQDYIDDLMEKSEVPETIDPDKIKNMEVRDVPPEEVKQKREEFSDRKFKQELKRQWEGKNGIPWPKYDKDVYSPNGSLLRKAGQDYDAHHIQPLSKGGENTAENITPLHVNDHYDSQGVHAPDSPCSKLV